jgi:phosphatidylglycerol:prolipoprotein diacylglycerol transferase
LNQELPGRVTEVSWGMYFQGETLLRHPSTLYGVLFEGVALLFWMVFWQKKLKTSGVLTALYLISYATIRFFLEYFREPDWYLNPWLSFMTQGQSLSILMLGGGIFLWFWSKKYAKIENNVS